MTWEIQLFYWTGWAVITCLIGFGATIFLFYLTSAIGEELSKKIYKNLTYMKAYFYAHAGLLPERNSGVGLTKETDDYVIKINWEKKED